ALVVAREIRTDRLPMNAFIRGLEQYVRSHQQLIGVARGEYDRMMVPAIAIFDQGAREAELIGRPGAHVRDQPRPAVLFPLHAVVPAAVGDPGPARCRYDPAHLSSLDGFPDRRNGPGRQGARRLDRAAVLLRPVDMERELIVEVGVIELAGRLVVLGAPGLAAVLAHGCAAIVAFDEELRVVR